MGYNNKSYIPPTFDELLEVVTKKWNEEFGTNYDIETFKGTNAYRFAYVFIQTQIKQQAAVSEIYAKLQDYFNVVNAGINAATTTNEGIVREFRNKGYVASARDNSQAQAGTLAVAVDVDVSDEQYEDKEFEILNIIKDNSVAGLYCEGTQSGDITLSNGQVKTFKFTPAEKIKTKLQLEIKRARGSEYVSDSEDLVKEKLLLNLKNLYGLGQDFAPEKYFEIARDAPYAKSLSLKYLNPKTKDKLTSDVYTAEYTDLFTFQSSDIEVVFNE
jgi:hypothetical protein